MLNIIKTGALGLKELIKQNKVIIVAAGIQGQRYGMIFEAWGCGDNIIGYMDNDKEKQGLTVKCNESAYDVFSLEEAIRRADRDTIWYIASIYTELFLHQLDEYSNRAGIRIHCTGSSIVSEMQLGISDYVEIKHSGNEMRIPKTIHYAWFGGKKPDSIKRNIDHWARMCPDYTIKEWNESNYDVSKNLYMKQAYENKCWGFVPDYLRLDVVYNEGGIYLDTDIDVVKPLDDLLYQNCFGCIDASLVANLGSGFGAVQGNLMIRELRDYYNTVSFIKEDGTLDKTSCNTHNLSVFLKYGFVPGDQMQCVNGMNIYPMIFQGAAQYVHKSRITEKTYWVHYGNMSWFDRRS